MCVTEGRGTPEKLGKAGLGCIKGTFNTRNKATITGSSMNTDFYGHTLWDDLTTADAGCCDVVNIPFRDNVKQLYSASGT